MLRACPCDVAVSFPSDLGVDPAWSCAACQKWPRGRKCGGKQSRTYSYSTDQPEDAEQIRKLQIPPEVPREVEWVIGQLVETARCSGTLEVSVTRATTRVMDLFSVDQILDSHGAASSFPSSPELLYKDGNV